MLFPAVACRIDFPEKVPMWPKSSTASFETYEKYSGLGILGNVGYRWRFKSGMFLNLGLYAGPVTTLSDKEYYKSDDSLYDEYSETLFFGFLELSFGWESAWK